MEKIIIANKSVYRVSPYLGFNYSVQYLRGTSAYGQETLFAYIGNEEVGLKVVAEIGKFLIGNELCFDVDKFVVSEMEKYVQAATAKVR